MQIIYQLAGAGWADARIIDGSNYRDMSVSYLSDALGDMAQAAVNLLRGGREVSFAFEDEPGEHFWILARGANDSIKIRILWFEDTLSSRNLERGIEVFKAESTVLDFVSQVSAILSQILGEHGIAGYKKSWQEHEFPIEHFYEIQRLLSPQQR